MGFLLTGPVCFFESLIFRTGGISCFDFMFLVTIRLGDEFCLRLFNFWERSRFWFSFRGRHVGRVGVWCDCSEGYLMLCELRC